MLGMLFFPLCRSFRPFFLFFFSSFLGPRGASNSKVLWAVFGANFPSTWGTISRELGAKFPVNLGLNFPSELGANDEVCPKRLWISLLNAYRNSLTKHIR